MRGINKVILVGTLGRDPETRFTPDGKAITNLAIATSESWKDKKTGDIQENTEWHKVVLYEKLAEIASEYLKKGSKVYIEGKIRTSKWKDKETGSERKSTDIVGKEMQMLDSKNKPEPKGENQEVKWASMGKKEETFDDDIPFWLMFYKKWFIVPCV